MTWDTLMFRMMLFVMSPVNWLTTIWMGCAIPEVQTMAKNENGMTVNELPGMEKRNVCEDKRTPAPELDKPDTELVKEATDLFSKKAE